MYAIEVQNLTKRFSEKTAVDNISFKVKKGEIFAFLGPNGAGKSTTIKILTTIQQPSSGTMSVGGFDVQQNKDDVRRSIGVIFQDNSVDNELTAYENMYYHAVLYGIPRAERKGRIDELLDYVGLLGRKDDIMKTFSGGMKRRVEIARGLLHSPKILFLDEPTLGLDVQTRNFLWSHIRKVNKEHGLTVFFTTHNMDEAEKIAHTVAIIDKGKILIDDTTKRIKTRTKTKTLEKAFLKLTGYDIRDGAADSRDMMRRWHR